MNKELLDKLKFQAAAQVSPLLEGSEWQRVFTEKFADLIVKECISKCDGNGEYKNHTDTEFGQGVAAGIKIAKAQIQIHFGVEE